MCVEGLCLSVFFFLFSDIPRIPETSHPPLESSEYCFKHCGLKYLLFPYLEVSMMSVIILAVSLLSLCHYSRLKFLRIAEDGATIYIRHVPFQSQWSERCSSAASWTTLGGYNTNTITACSYLSVWFASLAVYK